MAKSGRDANQVDAPRNLKQFAGPIGAFEGSAWLWGEGGSFSFCCLPALCTLKIQEICKISTIFDWFSTNSCNSGKIPWKFQWKIWYSNRFRAKFCKIWKNHQFLQNFAKIKKNWVRSGAKDWKSCRSQKTLKNEYLVAKFGFDTAENEPSKVLPCLPASPSLPTKAPMERTEATEPS